MLAEGQQSSEYSLIFKKKFRWKFKIIIFSAPQVPSRDMFKKISKIMMATFQNADFWVAWDACGFGQYIKISKYVFAYPWS